MEKKATMSVAFKETPKNCPCGACVSCACAANPKHDEDGLCIHCGGQTLAMAWACRLTAGPPHVSPDVDEAHGVAEASAHRDAILALIAKGYEGTFVDAVCSEVEVRFDIWDRLRILLHGRARVNLVVPTEHEPGELGRTETYLFVPPVFGRRPMLMASKGAPR